ncbi:hypothetical protein MARPO_0019s0030 [Marchantia polymorpha]|uniref:Secreted protein n=1 Tax=Marchantia polymorpha TaxID=3197 RepID=A0A2R6XES1_MARPO|nr:hypothetical protein MARPO_0019s0030 [Marchantia polymorpha]|eukprot:PTQ44591.1 hypothetical protein MARPO_0019s0030 [Marchantia polymorpha]
MSIGFALALYDLLLAYLPQVAPAAVMVMVVDVIATGRRCVHRSERELCQPKLLPTAIPLVAMTRCCCCCAGLALLLLRAPICSVLVPHPVPIPIHDVVVSQALATLLHRNQRREADVVSSARSAPAELMMASAARFRIAPAAKVAHVDAVEDGTGARSLVGIADGPQPFACTCARSGARSAVVILLLRFPEHSPRLPLAARAREVGGRTSLAGGARELATFGLGVHERVDGLPGLSLGGRGLGCADFTYFSAAASASLALLHGHRHGRGLGRVGHVESAGIAVLVVEGGHCQGLRGFAGRLENSLLNAGNGPDGMLPVPVVRAISAPGPLIIGGDGVVCFDERCDGVHNSATFGQPVPADGRRRRCPFFPQEIIL